MSGVNLLCESRVQEFLFNLIVVKNFWRSRDNINYTTLNFISKSGIFYQRVKSMNNSWFIFCNLSLVTIFFFYFWPSKWSTTKKIYFFRQTTWNNAFWKDYKYRSIDLCIILSSMLAFPYLKSKFSTIIKFK